MRSKYWKLIAVMTFVGVVLCAAAYAKKARKAVKPSSAVKATEAERKVTEAEVPKAALATLKKMARGAKITEFAEEIEYGHTFYEGSWKAKSGANIDVLVTEKGDLVEIEREVKAGKVPAAVLKAARKAAGEGTKMAFESKTMILYEVKFRKDDVRHEMLLTPDGRILEKEIDKGNPNEAGDGDGDDDDDADDDDDEDEDD